MTTYAIVDVANLFHRARHAVRGDTFTKAGMTLNIIFRSIKKLYRDFNADHVVLCAEGRSWRYDLFPEYKIKSKLKRINLDANDKEEEQIFYDTMNEFIEFMRTQSRCTVLQAQGVEGDDFMARWTQLHPEDNHIILSGDNDFLQLVSDNVSLYNGMENYHITSKGVFNEKQQEMYFLISPSDGKLKVKGTVEDVRKKHEKDEKAKVKADPNYEPTPFEFAPEKEWWKKALFLKIIRGDASDGIFSAYPGVRYNGSSKRVGIHEAWEDREAQGYAWNNFMLSTWEKAEYGGETKTVTVKEEFAFNEMLIDLTKQPDNIKEIMDHAIIQAVNKPTVSMVGINFTRFCKKHELPLLSKESDFHAQYLGAGYGRN
jgi:5'-3' exonuclease